VRRSMSGIGKAPERIPGNPAELGAMGVGIATGAAAALGAPEELWIAAMVCGVLFVVLAVYRWRKPVVEPPPSPAEAERTSQVGVRSLALRLRDEARHADRLRAEIAADPLTSTMMPPRHYDDEIERWTKRVVALLERQSEDAAAHEFLAPLPRNVLAAVLGLGGNHRDRLDRELGVRGGRLGAIADRLTAAANAECVRDQLDEGLALRGRLDMEADPDRKRPAKDDPVYWWALASWKCLRQRDPMLAQQFFGSTAPYSEGYFMTAYAVEVDGGGRRAYLDSRIALLDGAMSRPG
jgi:hypothetical protein